MGSALALAASPDRWAVQREAMVQQAIVDAGITNARVIDAMGRTPRHVFVPASSRQQAYFDMALPIGSGQTISPPFVVALMTEELDPQPSDKVLEIGTGSGYQAAVLSPLVGQVYSIEIVQPLGRQAARRLERLGCENVHIRIGDGYEGWPEQAPFDKIVVTCSPEAIPPALAEQLAEGGRMIVPLGERYQQRLYRFEKRQGTLQQTALRSTFFVPMTGEAERHRRALPDLAHPELVNGSFEQSTSESGVPDGWYYVCQASVERCAEAPDGTQVLVCSNETPTRRCHALQAFGVDGREVTVLNVGCSVRADTVEPGPTPDQQAKLLVEFYGPNRVPVGQVQLGPWQGTFSWRNQRRQVPVPGRARLAVLAIGLFGGTGQIGFDQVEVASAARPKEALPP